MTTSNRYWLVLHLNKWEGFEVDPPTIVKVNIKPPKGSAGYLEAYETLEDTQREYPNAKFAVIEIVSKERDRERDDS